ncbi:hypothetical protein [Dyella choica]|uniref:Uncharacterized protein n=1 Tax=Dyella choica TaxID=1927959 RepID=A0A3S0PFZ7_9GAMM|nr:hypothetical protein [Dyella choica]RUL70969.1 hypothetical protein EKH80_19505 [Dyella choica]
MKASWIKIPLLVSVLVAWSSNFSAYARSNANASIAQEKLCAANKVTQTNEIAARLAPIKSIKDLNAYIARTPAADSPLDYLSPEAKNRFISSLQFNGKGITSFSYADLEAELTPSQIYKLLSLFGMQRTVPFMKGARVVDDTDKMIMAVPMGDPCGGGRGTGQSSKRS